MLGHWKNFEDIEENLSLAELEAILDAAREKEHEDRKFTAALQGVDIDKSRRNEEAFSRRMRAEAIAQGKSEEQYEFEFIGMAIESDEEGE